MTDEPSDGEMTHMEFLRAQFFSAEPVAPKAKPRRSRRWDPDLLALKRFAQAVEKMDPSTRRASIKWLADKYLGVRL